MNKNILITHIISSLGMWTFGWIVFFYFLNWPGQYFIPYMIGLEIIYYFWKPLLKAGKWILFLITPAIVASFFGTSGAIAMGIWLIAGLIILFIQNKDKTNVHFPENQYLE